ncbi:superoxide dismutase [Bacillus sp. Marseille-P3661]|uniref:superoxide dismutase n=1 Tax=Bacillus sp. Marseille-P3661 TaxID=1936234 RepID=UPI000C817265|nr:superoxide dismutase [Bacillus sp. Marseille-P3661]
MAINEHHKYLMDVKEWSSVVDQLLKENNIKDESFLNWKQQIDQLIFELENLQDQSMLDEEKMTEIQEQTRTIYEDLQQRYLHQENRLADQKVKPGGHTLPPLPYSYDALEPYISEEIMRLHHDKHHQSYVDGLNKAEKKMKEARDKGNYDLIKHWEREAAFNGSGHYLHTIFWKNMSPNGGGSPQGSLLKQINVDFGSFDDFKTHFSEAANKVEGVGWAILVWSPRSRRLEILQSEKHQHYTQWDTIPLLVLDVWEHAYYLQYQNERSKYIENWWNVVNWDHVYYRFQNARKLKWEPY